MDFILKCETLVCNLEVADGKIGAAYRTRICDLFHVKEARYQLRQSCI